MAYTEYEFRGARAEALAKELAAGFWSCTCSDWYGRVWVVKVGIVARGV